LAFSFIGSSPWFSRAGFRPQASASKLLVRSAHDDYLSCRRALQRAISELSILLLNDPEPVAVNPTSPDESNHSIPTPEAELRRLIR
jgi:hypothetical protein